MSPSEREVDRIWAKLNKHGETLAGQEKELTHLGALIEAQSVDTMRMHEENRATLEKQERQTGDRFDKQDALLMELANGQAANRSTLKAVAWGLGIFLTILEIATKLIGH